MEQGTTAAYLALPVTQHATEFFIPSYHNTPSVTFHAGFAVAGLDDGTCMEVYKVKGDVYERYTSTMCNQPGNSSRKSHIKGRTNQIKSNSTLFHRITWTVT